MSRNAQGTEKPASASRSSGASSSSEVEELTERQQRVLEFIEAQIHRNGYPPTIREIGRHLGIKSTNGVNDHLNALQRKGYIKRQDHKSRTLAVVRSGEDERAPVRPGRASAAARAHGARGASARHMPGLEELGLAAHDDLVEVPLLGRVAAGAPILAEENREDTVRVSSFFLGRGHQQEKIFALRVVGDSMIDDGIFDGDFLFVKKQPSARTGEIVVAMIEGEATVKRYFPEGDRIRFQPANARLEPIFVHKREFRQTDILGIVVGVYRRV
jgi:repressor LexA